MREGCRTGCQVMSREINEEEAMRRMKQLLQQGAVMLNQTCPICGLPLFRLKNGDVVCPIHGKVFLVSSDEEAREVEISEVIKLIEYRAIKKLEELLNEDFEPSEAFSWLRLVEEVERIRNLRAEREASTRTSQREGH
jgi:UPF0148 protein